MPVRAAAVSITASIDWAKPSVIGRVSTGFAECSQLVSLSDSLLAPFLKNS